MRKLIETITKNKREEIRVALTKYEGHDLCDVRVFSETYTSDERVATPKGISLSVAKLPVLIEALQKAEAEARAAGLLKRFEADLAAPTEATEASRDDAVAGDLTVLGAG